MKYLGTIAAILLILLIAGYLALRELVQEMRF